MRFFPQKEIDFYMRHLIYDDREIASLMDQWNVEKEDVASILAGFFKSIGVFTVYSHNFERVIYNQVKFQLKHSPVMKAKIKIVEREIAKVRARQRR